MNEEEEEGKNKKKTFGDISPKSGSESHCFSLFPEKSNVDKTTFNDVNSTTATVAATPNAVASISE